MAKKKDKGSSRKNRDYDDLDNESDKVSDSIEGSDEEKENKDKSWDDRLIEAIDGLTEKRATTRINNLQIVYDIMSEHYARPILSNRIDTLIHGVLSCVTRGTSDKECILGLETITVILITLGREYHGYKIQRTTQDLAPLSDETYQRLREVLIAKCKEGKSSETNQNIRAAALFALAIYGFIQDDPRDLVNNIGLLSTYEHEFWKKEKDPNVLSQAITSWTIMASAVPLHLQVNILIPRVKAKLIKMLTKSENLAVRMACGEALALLYESNYRYQQRDDDEEGDSEPIINESDAPWIEQLRQLSTLTSKQVAKRDRSVQKSSFRDVINTIEEGESPEVKIVVKKNTLTFDTWNAIVQYNAFKTVLGSGLIHHFSDNDFVKQVFGVQEHKFDEKSVRKLNKSEKQAMFSKKAAHQKLNTIEKAIRTRSAHDLTLLDNDD